MRYISLVCFFISSVLELLPLESSNDILYIGAKVKKPACGLHCNDKV